MPRKRLEHHAQIVGMFHDRQIVPHHFIDDQQRNRLAIERGHLNVVRDDHAAVTAVNPLEHVIEGEVLFAGALTSQEANQDPIHLALFAMAE